MGNTSSRLRLTFPAPHSKKNRGTILRGKGGRPFYRPSAEVIREAKAIGAMARELLGDRIWDEDGDVMLDVVYHARSQTVDVELIKIQPRPKGFTGRRRDLHGMVEAIADALEGTCYRNDNQIAEVRMERRLD